MSVRHETYKMKIISEDIEEAEPVIIVYQYS